MSARLIKSAQSATAAGVVPFVLPQETQGSRSSVAVNPFTERRAQAARTGNSIALQRQAEPARQQHAGEGSLEAARVEADRIVQNAQARAAEIEEQARERGLNEGRSMAQLEMTQTTEPLLQQLTTSIAEVAALRTSVSGQIERDLVKLAIEIAKKIVHREVTMDSEVALTLVRVALARIHNRAQAVIHLHPEDFAFVQNHLDRLPAGSAIDLVEDRAIGRGGCLIETEMGDTDARIEQQFEELERSFLRL